MREAKSTAFRGWVYGSDARARAFSGWTILRHEAGQIWQLEGAISAVAEASGSLSLVQSFVGASSVQSDLVASIILRVGFQGGDAPVATAADAVLWLRQVLSGEILAEVDVFGKLSTGWDSVFITSIEAEKAVVVVDAHLAGDDELSSEVTIVGTVGAIAQTIDALLADKTEKEGVSATVAIRGGTLPGRKRTPERHSGNIEITKIDGRR